MRRARVALAATASLVVSLAASPSRADSPDGPGAHLEELPPKHETFDAAAWLRLRGTAQRDFPLDTLGTRAGQSTWLETRLRLGLGWRPLETVTVRVEGDAVDGLLAGDTTPVGTGPGKGTLLYPLHERSFYRRGDLRQLYVAWRTRAGELRLGQMTSSWGLGLLANDGDGEPTFGDKRYGDRVERLLFATRPLARATRAAPVFRRLTIAIAFDLVYRDANARLVDDDQATQAVVSAFTTSRDASLGFYAALRNQTDRADAFHPERARTTLSVGVLDVWGAATFARLDRHRTFRVEGEAAYIGGSTTRPYFDETRDGAGIRSFGGALRLRYDDTARKTSIISELGYASGDNDPHDKTVRAFSFNPDYKVGLILFDQVLPRMSARAADRAVDPSLVAVPSSGLRYVPTQGAVTNAVYLNPTVRIAPVERLEVRAGWLLAWSAADLVDPFSAQIAGGYNTTYGGKSPGSRALGQEVDASVRYRVEVGERIKLRVGAEGGLFFAGRAFDGIAGEKLGTVWTARLMADAWF